MREENRVAADREPSRYDRLIEEIFFQRYLPGDRALEFHRSDMEDAARKLKIPLPKNLGDVVYSFRYRTSFPKRITDLLGPEEEWTIRPAGRGVYKMAITRWTRILPNPDCLEILVPDATPGLFRLYMQRDEQALLTMIKHNRLIDTFLALTCYPLQSHLRTSVPGIGQVETDDLYVGIDRRGAHYVVPVQAKGRKDWLNIVQIEQDFAVSESKFPELICCPVGAQFMEPNVIVLFEFVRDEQGEVKIAQEKHYRLVPEREITSAQVVRYRGRAE